MKCKECLLCNVCAFVKGIKTDKAVLQTDFKCPDYIDKNLHTPKKPILDKEQTMRFVTTYTCPTCNKGFSGTKVCAYCYHCGQALDWSDTK